METITNLFKQMNEYLDTPEGQAMLEQLGSTISSLISDLTKVNPEDAVGTLEKIVTGITDGLKWISENSGAVVTGIEAFIGAFALIETAKGVTTVLQLINGIKGLTGASAASAGEAAGASWASSFATAALKAAPFLAFLYTLLNPAGTAGDDLDLLWDANGNPTQAARDAGITQTYDEYNGGLPDWLRREQEEKVQKHLETTTTGDTEAATARNDRWRSSSKALEDLQNAADKMDQTAEELTGGTDKQKQSSSEMSTAANTLKGMPAEVYDAILKGFSNVKIYIDGQQAGSAITPYVNSSMAGILMTLNK